MKYFFLFAITCFASSLSAQTNSKTAALSKKTYTVKSTSEELALYELIKDYRKKYNLPDIPLSRALTYVAQQHCKDLANNKPDTGVCNMHSWSSKGVWTSCCYTGDHKNVAKVWIKPSELTNYKGYGYEIAFDMGGGDATALQALYGWRGSFGHNQLLINAGPWSAPWKAIGIGIYGRFAMVWFGHETDDEGAPGK